MIRAISILLSALLVVLAAPLPLCAQSPSDWQPAIEAFDQAWKAHDAQSPDAPAKLAAAADKFQSLLNLPLSDHDRARVLYNLGAIDQLRSAPLRGLLHFRTADLLFPALPGLDERLYTAQLSTSSEPQTADAYRPPSGLALVTDLFYSAPRTWLLWTALAAWSTLWIALGLLLLRRLMVPVAVLAALSAFVWLAAAAWFTAIELRLRSAENVVMVITEAAPKDQPDALVGSTVGSLSKPGTELFALERRLGSDGSPWLRVSRESTGDESSWIPANSCRNILPPDTLFRFDLPRSILRRGPTAQTS